MEQAKISGACKCGACTYSGRLADAQMFRCYCRDCQRLTGTGHSEMMPLERASFLVEGPMCEFEMRGGSGQSTWSGFCGTCGAPLMRRSARMGELVYVHAGSLVRPEAYCPAKVIYTDAAQPWDKPGS